jgi:ligand-binding SRPBCC domain-containing protein
MADHVLERRLWLPHPRERVFAFFADALNIARVNPASARPRWLAPPPPLSAGAVLDFSVRALGVPVRWRVFVREFDAPYRFVDVQLWGPFARWEHRHRFLEEPAPGAAADAPLGTLMEDRVTYRLPLAGLGRLAHALGAGRQITRLFDYREERLRELFP